MNIYKAKIQGNLDSLCGVYAIVNSTTNLTKKKLNKDQLKELFKTLCLEIISNNKMEYALFKGIDPRFLGILIDKTNNYYNKFGIYIHREILDPRNDVCLNDYWQILQNHVEENGAGSAIISLEGTHQHWTVVKNITDTTISLIDSDHLSRLNRKNCTVSDARKGRVHRLVPSQTYLLSVKSES